eukprot:1190142-Prorocentrum_minimum.AAC.2
MVVRSRVYFMRAVGVEGGVSLTEASSFLLPDPPAGEGGQTPRGGVGGGRIGVKGDVTYVRGTNVQTGSEGGQRGVRGGPSGTCNSLTQDPARRVKGQPEGKSEREPSLFVVGVTVGEYREPPSHGTWHTPGGVTPQ